MNAVQLVDQVLFLLLVFGHYSSGRNMHCRKVIVKDSDRHIPLREYFNSDFKDEPKDEYDLLVSNSGPAVLGSEISFDAEIKNKKGQVGDFKQFRYIWTNDADGHEFEMNDDFNATYSKTFYDDLQAMIYTMKVCVYDLVQSGKTFEHVRVAQGMTYFKLTEYLNGNTESHQNLPHLLKKNVYETNSIVHFKVNLTDRFDYERSNSYLWTFKYDNDRKEVRIPTIVPEVTYNSSFVGSHSLDLIVTSYPVMRETFEELQGKFNHRFVLKDRVSSAEIHLKNGQDTGLLPIGQELTFNITYLGSNPTVICWNLVQENDTVNSTSSLRGENCSKPITGNKHSYLLSFQLETNGEQYINVSVQNDVSQVVERKFFYGYTPGSSGYTSAAIPVVFSLLGICVIVIGVVYIVRVKRKTSIEVADFDFHPSLHHGDNHPFIRVIKNKVSTMFSRNLYFNTHKNPAHKETTAKNYGAFLSSHELEHL